MILHYVSHLDSSGKSEPIKVTMAKSSSLYLTMMQAKAQGLQSDLERSDVYLNGIIVEESVWKTTRLSKSSRVHIKPRQSVASAEIVEID